MKKSIYSTFIAFCLFFSACIDKEAVLESKPEIPVEEMTLETIIVPENFDYSTTQNINIELSVPNYLSNASFSFVAYQPEKDSLTFATATFGGNNHFEANYTIAAYIDTIMVNSGYMGMPSGVKIPIINGRASLNVNDISRGEEKSASVGKMPEKSAQGNFFYYIGSYNYITGWPYYLTDPDEIDQEFLDDINSTLPEKNIVPETSPELIADGAVTRIEITKKADVWVTFVGEGAGYKNALGYYKYKVGEEPKTKADIDTCFVLFPNASLAGSGGALKPGDKVHLGQFEANTVIEWFLATNSFYFFVNTNAITHFSQSKFNVESKDELKPHMVMLWDKQRELYVLAFEDMRRDDKGCDNDFNDVIFYTTTNPVDAVKTANMQEIKTTADTDGDGVSDSQDEYPDDPNKAFNSYSPGVEEFGTLAYEDLWPSKGDYDFNDLMVQYKYNLISNEDNKVTAMEAQIMVKHIGGSLPSAFAFTLPIAANQIENIENQQLSSDFISTNANGTEAGVDEAVIFVFDNARQVKEKEISLRLNFTTPVKPTALGSSPFNPFIVINEERAREIHLPDLPPTSKGKAYLGQNDDNSNSGAGKYYRTKQNLPWALNFYSPFTAPAEKQSIDEVYNKFIPWATSGGKNHKDWYKKE